MHFGKSVIALAVLLGGTANNNLSPHLLSISQCHQPCAIGLLIRENKTVLINIYVAYAKQSNVKKYLPGSGSFKRVFRVSVTSQQNTANSGQWGWLVHFDFDILRLYHVQLNQIKQKPDDPQNNQNATNFLPNPPPINIFNFGQWLLWLWWLRDKWWWWKWRVLGKWILPSWQT